MYNILKLALMLTTFVYMINSSEQSDSCRDTCINFISVPFIVDVIDPNKAENTSVSLDWCATSCKNAGSNCTVYTYRFIAGANVCTRGKFAILDPHAGRDENLISFANAKFTDVAGASTCPSGFKFSTFDNQCYVAFGNKWLSELEASVKGRCGKLAPGKNAWLPTPDTPEKHAFLKAYVQTDLPKCTTAHMYWTAAMWKSGEWKWTNPGEEHTYEAVTWAEWNDGYPAENSETHPIVAMMKYASYELRDSRTNVHGCIICTYKP